MEYDSLTTQVALGSLRNDDGGGNENENRRTTTSLGSVHNIPNSFTCWHALIPIWYSMSTYQISDSPLKRSTRRSFELPCGKRAEITLLYAWTDALFGMVFVRARKLSIIVLPRTTHHARVIRELKQRRRRRYREQEKSSRASRDKAMNCTTVRIHF